MNAAPDDDDSPWKDAVERYLPDYADLRIMPTRMRNWLDSWASVALKAA